MNPENRKAPIVEQPQPQSSQSQTQPSNEPPQRLPSDLTLQNACKLSISEDKPIMLDYWSDSIKRRALIGFREETNEKMLVKSAEEYTSPIAKLYRSGTEIIVVTENSIYLVASDIPTRKIT